MRTFITGGAGYVGSHTCKLLAKGGHEVLIYDNLSRGHEEFVKWGQLIEGDLNDRDKLKIVLKEYRPEAVVHFAALAYVSESVEQPEAYYLNNVVGTLSLLQAMRKSKCDKIVFSSSCATYGQPEQVPISEDTPQRPINPYGASKLMCERICQDFDRAYGIRHVILRYFNASGADPDGEIGEWHEPESHLIPRILMAASSQSTVEIFGDNYPTPDGTCIRDYVHVSDLAEGHAAALDYLGDGRASESFNLGAGHGRSVLEVIQAVEKVIGRPVVQKRLPRRLGDPAVLVADTSKASSALGWYPRLSDLGTIVATAWDWHCKLWKVAD